MQITDILAQMGGLQALARDLGANETEVARGAEALAPAILGGFKKQAQSGGIDGLAGLLGQLGGSGLLEQVLGAQPTDAGQGNQVLGQIFGSKDVSRSVAQDAATRTGLDPALLRKMLPLLAMLVGGFLSKQQGGAQAQSSGLGGLGGLAGLVGGLLGGKAGGTDALGGLGSLLDLGGQGNPLDDILGGKRG